MFPIKFAKSVRLDCPECRSKKTVQIHSSVIACDNADCDYSRLRRFPTEYGN